MPPSSDRARVFARLIRLALLAHPRERRARDGEEIEAAAIEAFARRRRRGWGAALGFAARVWLDVVVSGVRERVRYRRTGRGGMMMWSDGWMDVRLAIRTLARSPAFSVAAVLVLALGIGANTVVFSAIRATLLAAPPYPDHERLVFLDLTDSTTTRPGPARTFPWSYPKFQALLDMESLPLEDAAAYAVRPLTLTGAGDAAHLSAELVTPAYFGLLDRVPEIGRDFSADDNQTESSPVTVLEHGLWTERFGADSSVVGRDVTLNGRAVTVIGIAPPGFEGLSGSARLWVTVADGAALTAPFLVRNAQAHWLRGIGRMEAGIDLPTLQVRMMDAGLAIEETFPGSDPTVVRGGSAQSFDDATVNPQARTALLVLAAASLLLLLVACANLAGLLVARAHARSRDSAVRVALGAGRWRVVRSHLAEALLLAAVGCLAAVAIARVGLGALGALWPDRFMEGSWNVRATDVDLIGVDATVVAFAAGVSLATALLFGLIPAVVSSRSDPARRLRTKAERGRAGPFADVRSALVAGEIAMALVLVVGAGLLVRSLGELRRVDRGFEAGTLVTFAYQIPRESAWAETPAAFHEQFLERLESEPGVEAAALSCVAPLGGHCMITGLRRAGDRSWPEGSQPSIGVHFVSDGLFETLGVPVLRGRAFTSEDQADSRPVAVLSESAVLELFPDGSDPLGQRISAGISLTPEDGQGAEVIGVVGDVLWDRPAAGVMPELYVSNRQQEGGSTVLVRVRGEPLSVVPRAREILSRLDPDVPVYRVRTLDDLEARAAGDTRVMSVLLSGFAALALLLACTGVWAVVAFSVTRRTREIGVRVALGADSGRVMRTIQRRGLAASLVGVSLGAVGAWALSRLLRGMLFGVGPADPLTFVLAAVLLVGVSALASWIPARRATRVDPVVALRAE